MTPGAWLQERMHVHADRKVLVVRFAGRPACGPGQADVATQAGCTWIAGLTEARACPVDERHDLVLVVEQLESMAVRERKFLLARLRDLVAPRVEVCIRVESARDWPDSEWRALEFEPRDGFVDGDIRYATFEYDLATYNPERSWNTPEHWANPASFDRYR
jgi:Family of unknown function (DUF6231)